MLHDVRCLLRYVYCMLRVVCCVVYFVLCIVCCYICSGILSRRIYIIATTLPRQRLYTYDMFSPNTNPLYNVDYFSILTYIITHFSI